MARILYIFPHPDDESFGPAPLMARQRREGHDVFLLTLTRGEATSQREKLGFSKDEMGAVRVQEMQCVAKVLDLHDLTVLQLPDGELEEMPAPQLEEVVREHIERVRPAVVVTYPAHGISGHPDHQVCHRAVVKVVSSSDLPFPKRLAFFVLPGNGRPDRPSHLQPTPDEEIDCIIPVEERDLEQGRQALECYVTYREVVEAHQPLREVEDGICLSFHQERFAPPLSDVFTAMREGSS